MKFRLMNCIRGLVPVLVLMLTLVGCGDDGTAGTGDGGETGAETADTAGEETGEETGEGTGKETEGETTGDETEGETTGDETEGETTGDETEGETGAEEVAGNLIAAGALHSCAVDEIGDVWCWGYDFEDAPLAGGSGDVQYEPTKIQGLSNIVSVHAGNWFACALSAEGLVSCWGDNTYGFFGNGEFGEGTQSGVAHEVPGLGPVTQVALGGWHACALKADGTVWCWGTNNNGELGNGEWADAGVEVLESVPQMVPGLIDVSQIAAGRNHACAVANPAKGLYCWGGNHWGQLGNGKAHPNYPDGEAVESEPQFILFGGVEQLWVHGQQTCYRDAAESVWCFGANNHNQLGSGKMWEDYPEDEAFETTPVLSSPLQGAQQMDGNLFHGCAIFEGGEVKCWGNSIYGALGNGAVVGESAVELTPVTVSLPSPATDIAAGGFGYFDEETESWENWAHTCASMEGGGVYCWGMNDYGQCGTAAVSASSLPIAVSLGTP